KPFGRSEMTDKIVAKTKHGELTLDQLAEIQPGMARLMKEIGERYHILYYAAKGGNWKLANHELKQIISLMKIAGTLRPKYSLDLSKFTDSDLNPIGEAIQSRDWTRFEAAYKNGISRSNELHEKYGYGFIRYILPKRPPETYDLSSSSKDLNGSD
ncbi:hypothetical protein J2P12_08015, partial [Candidatus Bathyarchaeota archaeon]|nr:hypothetical protein [Candidatus Bathyarchaeota archaeon]